MHNKLKLKMNLIREINIKYFRSIYNVKISNVKQCTIFSGMNDSGKSNILKALNLFFNNDTDWNTELNFYQDFNFKRLKEVRTESIKGKQFIQISITFNRGNSFRGSLPEKFKITRTWDRYSDIPKETDDFDRRVRNGETGTKNINIVRRSATQFLNRINFEYVPAIKDEMVFDHVLNLLQRQVLELAIKKDMKIEDDIGRASSKFQQNVENLGSDFLKATGVDASVSIPIDPTEIFQILSINTKYSQQGEYTVSLDRRGDGIRLRYLPSLYNYIAEHHKGSYIIAFEEPENSMEYSLGSQMALDFQNTYTKNAQIFITSHSPAFFLNPSEATDLFRVYKGNNITELKRIINKKDFLQLENIDQENYRLRKELGLINLQREFHKQFENKLQEYEQVKKQLEELEVQVALSQKPIVYTEGKTDVKILEIAWEKLYGERLPPFNILPIQTFSEGGGDGGYLTISKKIETVRDSEKLQIGLYDMDQAGFDKGFNKLPRSFMVFQEDEEIKVSKSGKGFAMVLPTPPGLEEFKRFKNLSIEYYFDRDALETKDEYGNGLRVIPLERDFKFAGETVETIKKTELYLSKVDENTKVLFAEKIVPELPNESFKNFKYLFEKIEKIIESLNTEEEE